MKDSRGQQIERFLTACAWADAPRRPLAGDASFRRYDRLGETRTAVLMDAPPAHEDVRPFVAIADHLRALGLSAPAVLAADAGAGLLLLEDLGDDSFTHLLENPDLGVEGTLYRAAVDVLVALHGHAAPDELASVDGTITRLPDYDAGPLLDETGLFVDWYLPAVTGAPILADGRRAFDAMWRSLFPLIEVGPQVLVLRDYHANNLMWLPERTGVARVGLLDFQDALRGHPAYDLVSLLQDARRDVPPELEQAMIDYYLAACPGLDRGTFLAAYAVLGAQRNTKVIGIFTRLAVRDAKPHYLDMIDRVWGLLERDLAHPALAPARAWFDRWVPPDLRRAPRLQDG